MGADGHVKIYDKEKFEQKLRSVVENCIASTDAQQLVECILETAEKHYTFEGYIIRYAEYGTNTWQDVDWISRTIRWYFRDNERLRQYDVLYLIGQLEVALMEAEVKDIVVWT